VGTPVTFTITVNPTPAVNGITNQALCNGSNTAAVTISGPVTNTVYTWTNNNTSIGLGATGTGNIASFQAINNTAVVQVATITVTPTFTNGGLTCTGTPVSFTITVNPTPNVNGQANQVLCANTATNAISFSGVVAGTTYSWTNSNTAIGLAASGTGNIGSFTATNATGAAITATITVTPSANGCTGAPMSFTITVNPTATVNAIANQSVCTGTATAAVTFTGAVAGTIYNWTNDNPSIGLAAAGTGNIASFIATNSTIFPAVATITVTPTTSAGCVGTPRTFTITVNGTSNINLGATAVRICLSDTVMTLQATPAGGVWTGRGVITGTSKFDPVAAGVGVSTLTYTVAAGCGGSANMNVIVNDCKERHNNLAGAIRIWPNPNSGRFNIQFLSDIIFAFTMDVVDANGQIVYLKNFSGMRYGTIIPMDLRNLPSGMYVLNMHNEQEHAAYQIIIAH
jgi:hypothetical protein